MSNDKAGAKALSLYQAARLAMAQRQATPEAPEVVNGTRLKTSQRERLALAERLAAGSVRDRQRAAHLVRTVEAEIAAARLAGSVEEGIADTLQRGRERGEVFEESEVEVGRWRKDDNGAAVRVKGQPILDVERVRRASRVDGLANLYRSGAISETEKRTADRLRLLWDTVETPVAVSKLDRAGAADRASTDALVVDAVRRGHGRVLLGQISAAVGERAWAELEAVVRHGRSIKSMATSRPGQRVITRVREALAIAESYFSNADRGLLPERNAKGM